MCRERYHVLMQRLMRTDIFNPPALGHPHRETYKLVTLDALIGKSGNQFVFGLLRRQPGGKVHIEDLSGSIPLDLTKAQITGGLITDGCFIIAQGVLKEGTFVVKVRIGKKILILIKPQNNPYTPSHTHTRI